MIGDDAVARGFVSKSPNTTHDDSSTTKNYLESLCVAHGVAGVNVAVLEGETITSLCGGVANKSTNAKMKPSTWMQQASLSKTLGAAYMVNYYQVSSACSPCSPVRASLTPPLSLSQAKGVPLTTPVVDVLKRRDSPLVPIS